MVGKVGIEPTQHEVTDLQSAATLQLRRLPNDPDFLFYKKNSILGSARLHNIFCVPCWTSFPRHIKQKTLSLSILGFLIKILLYIV